MRLMIIKGLFKTFLVNKKANQIRQKNKKKRKYQYIQVILE